MLPKPMTKLSITDSDTTIFRVLNGICKSTDKLIRSASHQSAKGAEMPTGYVLAYTNKGRVLRSANIGIMMINIGLSLKYRVISSGCYCYMTQSIFRLHCCFLAASSSAQSSSSSDTFFSSS